MPATEPRALATLEIVAVRLHGGGAAVALVALDDTVLYNSEVREPRSRVDDGGAQRVLVVAQDARHSGRARRESRHDDRVEPRPITVAVRLPGGGRAR